MQSLPRLDDVALPRVPETLQDTPRGGTVERVPVAEKTSGLQKVFDPNFWEERSAPEGFLARTFFSVFPAERAAWIVASGLSFSARVGASALIPHLTDSRVAMGAGVYALGIAVNWPIAYRLLRWQDQRECRTNDGHLDLEAYKARIPSRLAFLPKQELGMLACYTICSVPILWASRVWPALFGAPTGIAMSVLPLGLQWFLVKHYDALFSSPRQALRSMWNEVRGKGDKNRQ